MAVFDIVTFSVSAKNAALDIAVNLGGETPKAIVLMTNCHKSSNGTAGTTVGTSRGPDTCYAFATASAQHALRCVQQDGNSVQSSNTDYRNDRLLFTGSTFSQDWEVYLVSFSADNVRFNFANVPITLSLTREFTMLVFGGSDCEAYLSETNLGTGNTAIDITAPNFEPDIVFAAHCNRTATGLSSSSAGTAAISFGVGLNDGVDTQRCASYRDGSGTLTVNRQNFCIHDNGFAAHLNGGTSPTVAWRITIGTFDATGYSVTPSSSAGSVLLSSLAIKAPGLDFSLDDFLTKASTGTQAYTGTGFLPDALLVVGGGSTTINTAAGPNAANASKYNSMTMTGGDSGMYVNRSQNGVDPSVTRAYSNADASLISLGDAAFDDVLAGELSTFDSDGFTLNYTTAPATAYLFMGLSIADVGTGGSGVYVDSRFFF
jgi:hypothetical protein